MAPSCLQSNRKGVRPRATRSTIRIAYPIKGILQECKPPNWGRIQGLSTTRLTQLHDMLSYVLGLGGICLSPLGIGGSAYG
jgi:hypothetical protein